MFCPKCGKEVTSTDIFCKSCGFQIKEKTSLLNLKPAKTGKEAFLIYLSFLGIYFIFLLVIFTIYALTVHISTGMEYSQIAAALKSSTKSYIVNTLAALCFVLIVIHVKNLYRQSKSYFMLLLAAIITILFSTIGGFIVPAVMTKWQPVDNSDIISDSENKDI